MIEVKNYSFSYNEKEILHNINVSFPKSKITTILGSNGCGKSTLLKNIAYLLKGEGKISIDQISIETYSDKLRAQKISMMPQIPLIPEGITVKELVLRGRYPYQTFFSSYSKQDLFIVDEALKQTKLLDIENEYVESLSGGQRQRVFLALALAQDTPYLLLDEPTTYLDIQYQIELLSLLEEINQKTKKTIIMVLHDINLALRYSDYIIGMKEGKIIYQGDISIVDEKFMRDIYHLKAQILYDKHLNIPYILPM